MKFLSKKSCLSLALLASMSLVGCGGGGSTSVVGPVYQVPASVKAVQNSVTPVLQNADAIFNDNAVAAIRAALEADTANFDKEALGTEIVRAMDVNSFLRLALSIGGGNINSGIFMDTHSYQSEANYNEATRTFEKILYIDDKVFATYTIIGCSAEVKDKVLTKLSVNNGTSFIIDETDPEDGDKTHIEGSVSGGFTIAVNTEVKSNGKDTVPMTYETWTYEINKSLGLNITKASFTSPEDEEDNFSGNMSVVIEGISGKITVNNVYNQGMYFIKRNDYDNLTLDESVKLTVTGNLNNGNDKANVKKIEVLLKDINKVSDEELYDEYYYVPYISKNADITVAVEASHDKVISFAGNALNFNKANISIKNAILDENLLKFYRDRYREIGGYSALYKNRLIQEAMQKICANSTIHMDGTEKDNKLSFNADINIPDETAEIVINNAVNYTLTDDVKSFNFKTLNIKATGVDITQENCVGSKFQMTCEGVEKDGFTTIRYYKVEKGHVVINPNKDNQEKKAPADVPVVTIETDLPSTTEDINSQTAAAITEKTEKKPAIGGDLQRADKDGKRVAKFESKATGEDKIMANIMADKKNNVITASVIAGDKTIFTVVFKIRDKKEITGRIFSGRQNNASIEGGNDCIGYFSSKDGKNLIMIVDGSKHTVILN